MTAIRIILNNRNFVLVPESDWIKASASRLPAGSTSKQRRLTPTGRANALPPLPPADAQGNRPALAFADIAIARTIIQRRKRLGMSQVGLANLAGIRVEVLNRAERAVTIPSVRTLTKIEAVLQHLEHCALPKRRRSA